MGLPLIAVRLSGALRRAIYPRFPATLYPASLGLPVQTVCLAAQGRHTVQTWSPILAQTNSSAGRQAEEEATQRSWSAASRNLWPGRSYKGEASSPDALVARCGGLLHNLASHVRLRLECAQPAGTLIPDFAEQLLGHSLQVRTVPNPAYITAHSDTHPTASSFSIPDEMKSQMLSLFRSRRPQVQGHSKKTAAGSTHPIPFIISHTQAMQTEPASQRLPHELILQILGYLVPSVHTAAYRLPLETSNFTETLASSAAREVERSQRYLHWASQVCRDWHAVANELLYATPFLTTPRRMELFIRTLLEVPDLTRFVKDVYAPLTHKGAASEALGWMWGRKSTKMQRDELVTMLASCPSIEALTLRHSVKKSLASITPIDDIVRSSGIDERLKRLTVHGSSFEARWHPQFCIMPMLTDLMLPNLEFLCLRGIYVLPTFRLPELPKLHTLQLVENYYFPSTGPRGPLFSQETMPNLRTVEIFRNHFPEETHGPVFDVSCFTQLECLHFVQDERCLEVTRWADADSQVRHLALGFLHARDHVDLVCWRFPDALESLTLLLREKEVAEEFTDAPDVALDILDGVLRCLELNLQEASAFRKLSVLAKFPGARNTSARLARERIVYDIRELCTSKGVEFNYSLDAPDGWVAERLTRTHTHASMD